MNASPWGKTSFSVRSNATHRWSSWPFEWRDARSKAETLAAAAGVKTGRILEISEHSFAPRPMPMLNAEVAMSRAADEAPPVAAGENSYQVTVQVTYAIEQ